MKKSLNTLILISRIFVGVVFIYSGFVKGVDPLGTTYKINDYFTAFSVDWASSLSFLLSVLQSLIEVIVGISLLLNLKIKLGSWGALILMVIFTPLTFVLALTNPVHDCGCFGDALILTNWQTFWKNFLILIPVILVFIYRKKISSKLSCWEQWIGVGTFLLILGIIINYSYKHLPVIDFRPYKIGTHIPDKMVIPEGAPADEWESVFIYSKKGREKEFGLKNLPDSTWKFVDSKHILIKKGYVPPIHDFVVTSPEGDDITDYLLANDNYTFLLISYNLDNYNYDNQKKITALVDFCYEKGYNFYGITSSPDETVTDYFNNIHTSFDFYNADEITLKTIVRSNPGLVLIKSGTIIDKWHHNDIPEVEQLEAGFISKSLMKYKKSADNYYILLLITCSGLMITLYLLLRKKILK